MVNCRETQWTNPCRETRCLNFAKICSHLKCWFFSLCWPLLFDVPLFCSVNPALARLEVFFVLCFFMLSSPFLSLCVRLLRRKFFSFSHQVLDDCPWQFHSQLYNSLTHNRYTLVCGTIRNYVTIMRKKKLTQIGWWLFFVCLHSNPIHNSA